MATRRAQAPDPLPTKSHPWDSPVWLEWDLDQVTYPDGPACAYCGRPGMHEACCAGHDRDMCDTCRNVSGASRHADPGAAW